jgi:hypothetical protein
MVFIFAIVKKCKVDFWIETIFVFNFLVKSVAMLMKKDVELAAGSAPLHWCIMKNAREHFRTNWASESAIENEVMQK